MQTQIRIGRVARVSGVSIDAIRFYEKERLIAPAGRTAGGFRFYDPAAVARLKFIRRARELNFSIPEIRALIAQAEGREASAVTLSELIDTKIARASESIERLTTARTELAELFASCSPSDPGNK